MNNLAKALFVMGALSISIPVVAQNYGNNDRGDRYQQGRPSATFYGRNDYQGRGVTMDRPIRSFREMGLNDDISSIRIDGGRWEVCERNDFKGRCQVIDRSVRKTSTLGMNDMISSARPIGDGYGGGNGNGNGNGNGGNWNGGNGGGNGGGASSPLPGGSWSQSCRYAQMQGNALRAQCNNGQGRWISTQINPRQCQSGRAGNNAGNLSCE